MQNNRESQSCYDSIYDRVIKYQVRAECREPLHIGSGEKEQGEILIHPVEDCPFIPATGIAGVFREHFTDEELRNEMFGNVNENGSDGSRIRFCDGFFEKASVETELRPHVKIDGETGTCQSNVVKGAAISSGQKFEIESVAAGSEFAFSVYIFEKERSYEKPFEEALEALHCGNIQFGGQKSNGCGYVKLASVKKSVYTMTDENDRKQWPKEEKAMRDITAEITDKAEAQDQRLHFELSGKTEGAILVKAVSIADYSENAPDAQNIVNHRKEYMIPASSLKGIIRSQMEKIAVYKGMGLEIIDNIFGTCADDNSGGKRGEIKFFDCVVGNTTDNDRVKAQARIHIDKFTGGVISQALFSEKPAYGSLVIRVDMENADNYAGNALLLMALRDLGMGILPVGSGSSIGRGYLTCDRLKISKGSEVLAEIDLKAGKVVEGAAVIEEYIGFTDGGIRNGTDS